MCVRVSGMEARPRWLLSWERLRPTAWRRAETFYADSSSRLGAHTHMDHRTYTGYVGHTQGGGEFRVGGPLDRSIPPPPCGEHDFTF